MIKTTRLKNGTEEAEALVQSIMFGLRSLMTDKPVVFYELVMKCRDRDHQLFGESGKDLESLGLIQQDGHIHDSIRNIVLSATHGDGFEGLTLGDPIQEQADE